MLAVQLSQERPIAGGRLLDGWANAARSAGDGAGIAATVAAALAATTRPNGAGHRQNGLDLGLLLLFDGRIRLEYGEAIVERQFGGAVHVDLVDRLHDLAGFETGWRCVSMRCRRFTDQPRTRRFAG